MLSIPKSTSANSIFYFISSAKQKECEKSE